MDALHQLAEARIREAIDRGDLDDLPGRGRPLELDDLSRVPDELRASFMVCKNAGFLPPEVELRREALTLRDLLRTCTDDGERGQLRRKLSAVSLRLEVLMERHRINPAWRQYRDKLSRRLLR